MEIKLFLSDHVEEVHQFELGQLPSDLSPIQAEMKSWEGPWRKESLEHYAQLGWSFVAVKNDQIQGYLLGQPILFFNNWTQTLWVESLSFRVEEVGRELLDVAIRWAKTKHLQKVLVNSKTQNFPFIQENFQEFKENNYLHLSTTKMSED